jgi:hypothetical protein
MAAASGNNSMEERNTSAEERNAYSQTNLVSDGAVRARTTDPKLLNAWGVAFFPGGPFWVSDNGSGFATLYDGTGAKQALEVEIPTPNGAPQGSTATPTGMVFNVTTQFHIPGTNNLPALFIFDTEDGTIAAWNPNLADRTRAVLVVDNSQNGTGAVYKGLATGAIRRGTSSSPQTSGLAPSMSSTAASRRRPLTDRSPIRICRWASRRSGSAISMATCS